VRWRSFFIDSAGWIAGYGRALGFGFSRRKAVVPVEPAGPPFQNTVFGTEKARAWGVVDIPITYDP